MNDLITIEQVQKVYPNFAEGFRKAVDLFSKIQSFEDIEIHLLRGQGLSPHTYASYMAAVKALYVFTGGLNPFQIVPGHLEAFYDDLRKRLTISSCCVRMVGLKRFFGTIAEKMPGYVSPFDVMEEPLKKKFSQTSPKGVKQALTGNETRDLLAWLKARTDPRGVLAYRSIYMLVTTGFRAAELCGLRWDDIEKIDGVYHANGLGKGGKVFHQELFAPALAEIPHKGDHLFHRLDGEPLDPHSLWDNTRIIGEQAREAGIIAETRRVNFTPHLFRRSYATLLYKHGGMKIKALAEKTRHSSINTLLDFYIDDSEASGPMLTKILEPDENISLNKSSEAIA